MKATCVTVDGPFELDGDGACDWTVCLADDCGDPVGTISRCESQEVAQNYGRTLARKHRLELIDESMWA
jgi:hypothetical protein